MTGPQRSPGPLFATRRDVVAAIVMAVLLLSACAVAGVLDLSRDHGGPARTEADPGGEAGRGTGTPGRQPGPHASGGHRRSLPGSPSPAPAGGRQLATNATGKASGSPPGHVSYSGAGPSARGAIAGDASSLSWTHMVSGSGTALLVAVAVGMNPDSGFSASATDNGIAMRSLATVHDGGHPDGFLEVFGLAGVPDGANSIRVSLTGGEAAELTGGSESFAGAARAGAFSATATAAGDGTTPAVRVASRSGGMVGAFAACGSSILGAAGPAARAFIADDDDSTGAGNSAGAVMASAGGDASVSWSSYGDYWGAVAVQVSP